MSLAIIGAGVAGLAAAHALRDAGHAVTVFEKSRGVSGRAATRRRTYAGRTWRYDHGAQYAKAPPGSAAHRLLHEELPTDGLVDIDGAVWTFTADGTVAPGDPGRDEGGKWTYRDGISQLGKRLAAAAGADVRTATRIARLEHSGDGWTLETDGGARHGPFDAVLLTPPAPQSADLLAASAFDPDRRAVLVDGLRAATYRAQFSLVLAFEEPVARPDEAVYALVDTDRAHPVAWLAFEERKPGHVPAGSLLIAQMAPGWTRDHYGESTSALVRHVCPLLADLLGEALPEPGWVDGHRWRYALPDHAADTQALRQGEALGLFFAGDYTSGQGRVHLALESGREVAGRLRRYLR